MDYQSMTYGEALDMVMKSRASKVTLEKLRLTMGIKSNTTITRILKDESSYQITETFHNSLLEKKALRLTEQEKHLLSNALEVSRIGKTKHLINQEMMNFIVKKQEPAPWICTGIYGSSDTEIHYLSDLFDTYEGYREIKIFIIGCIYDGVISAVMNCMNEYSHVFVEHYITNERNPVRSAGQFISILPILNRAQYQCYCAYSSYHNELESINRFTNCMIVLKTMDDGQEYTDVISLKDKHLFSLVYNEPGENIKDFYVEIFSDMSAQYDKLKSIMQEGDVFDNTIQVSKRIQSFEEQWEQIVIKPHFCFHSVSADILMNLVDNDLKEQGKIRELYLIHKERHINYCTRKRHHIGIYSKQGILEFLRTGYFSDHISILRPLSRDEAKDAVRSIIKVCESNPLNQLYILKDEINYNSYQFTFFGSNTLFFCDNYTDYSEMDFSYIINSDEIITAMHSFVKTELIPKHCYNQSQSLDILRSLIS